MKKSKKVVGALLGMALTGVTGAFAQSGCGTGGACGSQKGASKSDMNKTMSGCGSQKAEEKLKKATSGGCGASK